MGKQRYVVFVLFVCALAFAIPASAQDAPKPVTVNLEDATGSLTLQRELQTMAQVELVVGDQVYYLNVPVTVQIDASTILTDAKLAAPVSQQVGIILFEPTEMERIEGDYEKEYRTVSPGSDNVIIVYRADVTNLTNVVLEADYTANLDTSATDEVGNMYEEEQRICGSVNPGEKVSCEFIFDVPATTNLIGLEIKTVAYKQFDFSGLVTSN